MASEISKFHFHSIGIVAANKPLKSKIIEVTPIEFAAFLNGEITDNVAAVMSNATDASGADYSTNIKSTVTVKATWLPIGSSNRITAPDVRRGEKVMLYRFADTDSYLWEPLKDYSSLRKLETVIYAFSDTTDESAECDAEHTYYFEVSTHRKLMHLHTGTSNGEPYAYDMQINAGEGFIQLQDDQGNFLKFNTRTKQISMVNQDGSLIEVVGKNINLSCEGEISMNGKVISSKATTINETATTINESASNINTAGNLAHKGNISAGGANGGSATATFNGSVSVSDSVTAPTFNGTATRALTSG